VARWATIIWRSNESGSKDRNSSTLRSRMSKNWFFGCCENKEKPTLHSHSALNASRESTEFANMPGWRTLKCKIQYFPLFRICVENRYLFDFQNWSGKCLQFLIIKELVDALFAKFGWKYLHAFCAK
jgi:hypothetical protein